MRKNFNSLSDFFKCDVGLLQGEVFSPFLFSLFVNDLETCLEQNANASFTPDQLSMYLLMFADDTVSFSESVEGLQLSLNNLVSYCNKWDLTVNIDKTKIVVFKKGGILSRQEKWTYASETVEIVNSFRWWCL